MNNPSNNPRHPDPSNAARSNLQNDFYIRQQERPDLAMLNKQDPKMDFDNFNDLLMNNFLRNPGQFPPFFDKGGSNPEFFNPAAQNPQGFPFDPNFLSNFSNLTGQPKSSSTAATNDALSQGSLLFPNMNSNFLIPPNFGLPSSDIYGDFMKNQNANQLNQLDLQDKNLFNPAMMAENPGIMDNQFLLQGMQNMDEFNFKPQDAGQAPKASQQANNMAGLGNFPNPMNPMLFNNPFGGDLMGNFFFPQMPGFNMEDFYAMQMQGGIPSASIPHNIGQIPMDLKVENSQQTQTKPQPQQNLATNSRNPQRNQQESAQQNARTAATAAAAEQKTQNPYSNAQDLTLLNGMQGMSGMPGMAGMAGMSGMPGMAGMAGMAGMPGMAGMAGMAGLQGMPGMQGKSMGMGGGLGMFNFPMQSLGFSKEMEHPAQLMKYMGGLDPLAGQEQQQSTKPTAAQNQMSNPPTKEPAKEKPAPAQMEEQKINPIDAMKQGFGGQNDLDLLNKAVMDPYMNPALKNGKGGFFDQFALDESNFFEAHSNIYNKMKEKNRYERSLKIERYKNKKRNWAKKIAYDCRKRVADTRLRIKGRFISKKDSEKIQQLVGKQEEAFNEKKNLKLDYLTNKFNIPGETDENNGVVSGKPNISKGYLLSKIDEILHNNKNPLPQKNLNDINYFSNIIRNKLNIHSKKIFKIRSRREDAGLPLVTLSKPGAGLKLKNEAYSDSMPNYPAMAQMGMTENPMLANKMKNPYFPEGFDMSAAPEMDHNMLFEAMAYMSNMGNLGNMGNMANFGNLSNMGNMNMNMGNLGNMEMSKMMGLGNFGRPEIQEENSHDMHRYKEM